MLIKLSRILLFLIFCMISPLQAQTSPEFQYIGSMGEPGNGPLQFRSPSAVDISPDGYLYIADTGNQRIQKISRG